MIYIHWLFLAIYWLVTLVTMLAVRMDNKQPAKTMAWLLILLFLPLVGVVLYIFFGQNFRKDRLINGKSMDLLTKRSMLEYVEQKDLYIPERFYTLSQLFSEHNTAMPFKNNQVDIYTDGYDFFLSLLCEIGKAQNSIHLESFIIANDALGRLVSDALIDKANQGVEVRFIYDDVACFGVPNAFFDRMLDAGIAVHSFMPVKFPAFTSTMNHRKHRKLCVIDGSVGFIGGMNIAVRYVKGDGKRWWRDTHLMVKGGAVYGIQRAFLVDWYFVDRTLLTDRKYYPDYDSSINNDCIAQVVTGSPTAEWPVLMHVYERIIIESKKYIYMETPYFLPTEEILFAIRTAALSGVDVRLMIPMKSDALFAGLASLTYIQEVIESGVKVYFYKKGFNHSKLLVSDDCLSTCGSTNIDFRSFEDNFESNIFFYDKWMSQRMKKVFLDDQRECILVDSVKRLPHRPWLSRLWESVVRLLSPLL